MRRLVVVLTCTVMLSTWAAVAATAAEDVDRFCEATEHIGGRIAKGTQPDPRVDRAFATRLSRGYDRVAAYAHPVIATDARALANYFRQLSKAGSTKAAVALANQRSDAIAPRLERLASYVSAKCLGFPPTTTTFPAPFVTYSVGGEGRATVTYSDATGAQVTKSVKVPWDTYVASSPGQSVRLSAEQAGDGIITCEITYSAEWRGDRVKVASDTQHGEHVTATCEGTT
jgi:hypothetical protein